jgi:hypothetical protein
LEWGHWPDDGRTTVMDYRPTAADAATLARLDEQTRGRLNEMERDRVAAHFVRHVDDHYRALLLDRLGDPQRRLGGVPPQFPRYHTGSLAAWRRRLANVLANRLAGLGLVSGPVEDSDPGENVTCHR